MILFDWQKVFEAADANAYNCYQIIKMITYKEIPKNKRDPRFAFSKVDFTGESFLVHPEPLFFNIYKYSFRELGVYLALASARNLADYLAYGDTTLNLVKIPVSDNMYTHINNNRLLTLEDNVIVRFKYEEVPPKKETH
jgi:hypothetical protein